MSGALFGGASGVCDVGDTASVTSSVANLAYLLSALIIAAVVIGGGLVLFGSEISAVSVRLYIRRRSPSLGARYFSPRPAMAQLHGQ